MDEVFIRIRGEQHHLWRAVDQHGPVLDILVQNRRNTKTAERFFRKLLRSYAAAERRTLPGVEHRQGRCLNNRVEASHQPTRRRDRQMQRFRSARHAPRVPSTHSRIHTQLQLRRHLLTAHEHRAARDAAFSAWREVAGDARSPQVRVLHDLQLAILLRPGLFTPT